MRAHLSCVAVLVATLHASGADAVDIAGVDLTFGGFGTVGVVHSTEHQGDFTAGFVKPTGAGYSHNWSSDADSLIAAQVSADFTPRLSAVVQVVSQQDADNSYRPHFQWANVKYQVTDDFAVRVGRIVMPFLLFSETREVAYTQTWVRVPAEVYSLSPITRSDGLDVSYRFGRGEWQHTVLALFGRQNLTLGSAGPAQARQIAVISETVDWHAFTVRAVYQQAHFTVSSFDPFFAALRQFGSQGTALAERYEVSGKLSSSVGVGVSYDPGNWFAISEWTHVDTRSALGTYSGWYVSAGYRIRNVTPYATIARSEAGSRTNRGLDLTGLPPYLLGPAAELNGTFDALQTSALERHTISVGARWDFIKNVDLKLQYDHTRTGAGTSGGLVNLQPGFRFGTGFGLISATIDFVF